MSTSGSTIALIVAAGRGERAGGDVPKQFRLVAGKSVLAHAVAAVRDHGGIDDMVVIIAAGQEDAVRQALGTAPYPTLVVGGAARRDSVKAGLDYLAARGGVTRVLVHDAARPFLPASVIDRLLAALDISSAAVPCIPVVDTLARGTASLGATVDRAGLMRVQTPQAFDFQTLLRAHVQWPETAEATDDAQMVRAIGHDVMIVEGDTMLEKLTLPADFVIAEQRLAAQFSARTGMGYDVHRLVPGEELWLCGIQVPHDKGLAGHSDADVALHALVDAILGALADGDIGSHFPPSDPQWRGAASYRFVEYARDRVRARGGRIVHVDLTIICEAPKIGPHRDAMRARIADLLELSADRVSVKATTTERLGFTGRGEGIAAQAIATVTLPDVR